MNFKLKIYLILLTAWAIFFIIAYGLQNTVFNIYNFHNLGIIKYHLLFIIFISLLLTLIALWLISSVVSNELEKFNVKLEQVLAQGNKQTKANNTIFEYPLRLSHYDPLTSLPNRVFFNEILNKAISQAKRHNNLLAIMIINIDDFRTTNNLYGQEIGNLVLKELSTRFQQALRAGDTIARLNGDEFIILLDNINDPKFASPVAEKILNLCTQSIQIQNKTIFITASIGIAIFPNDGDALQQLESRADTSMYKAKRLGGNLYQYYQHDLDLAAREHVKLENALRQAVLNHEFVLYYQPQLNLSDGNIRSVEALIRWNHPEFGLMSPEKFISLAEETDLIKPIGEWAIREACKTNKSWQEAGYDPVVVAVNISPKQFLHENLSLIIKRTLTEFNLKPRYLEIEITESVVLEDMKRVVQKLNELHQLGVRISIDDFGTGYTSINYLKQFPLNALKIDQTFIRGIPESANDEAIISSIISLGHNLGLEVIAEGVETTEQIQYLANQKCDFIQGYFLSRPLPENKIILQFHKR